MSKAKNLRVLTGFYALCFLIQMAGATITAGSVDTWYRLLEKSTLTPPGYWFGIVWSILYVLMAVAAWRVWKVERKLNTDAQRIWLIQLVTGLLWSQIFFGMQRIEAGLVIIVCLWALILCTYTRFRRIDAWAGRLLLPLVAWVSFATYLQAMIVHLN